MPLTSSLKTVLSASALVLLAAWAPAVDACGCFAPSLPQPGAVSFAVNQQAEQIIFEVKPEKISAHVRIFYQGDPEEFAWLLPMPNVPELELSNGLLFGLIDGQTSPIATSQVEDHCPQQQYQCRNHSLCAVAPPPGSPPRREPEQSLSFAEPPPAAEAPPNEAPVMQGQAPAVVVLAAEKIGSYDTIVFSAEDSKRAVEWLNDNDFIVNESMSPYIQPYLDAGMVFIASRLLPGADLNRLRPLKLTYVAEAPSIPIQLTAIAAEPHMMITAFIYADEQFEPYGSPLVAVPEEHVVGTRAGSNYPKLLSKAVDEQAGGYGFVREYVGSGPVVADPFGCCRGQPQPGFAVPPPAPPAPAPPAPAPPVPAPLQPADGGLAAGAEGGAPVPVMTDGIRDVCNIAGDGLCQCPSADFDAADCEEGVVEAARMAKELNRKYPVLTRLTTRLSAEEMVMDPEFRPAPEPQASGRLRLSSRTHDLSGCEELVIDKERHSELQELQAGCSDLYCDYGECVITEAGPGCLCDASLLARSYTESDARVSLTCVPKSAPVDFAAGGAELPDACAGITVKDGQCLDHGGFPAYRCAEGLAAVLDDSGSVSCHTVDLRSGNAGAHNHSLQIAELLICAPEPPPCSPDGWLQEVAVRNKGEACNPPDPSWLKIPPEPSCGAARRPPMATTEVRPTRDAAESSWAPGQDSSDSSEDEAGRTQAGEASGKSSGEDKQEAEEVTEEAEQEPPTSRGLCALLPGVAAPAEGPGHGWWAALALLGLAGRRRAAKATRGVGRACRS